jgi:hypothetical protein
MSDKEEISLLQATADGDECPLCQCGTVEHKGGEVVCRGECGSQCSNWNQELGDETVITRNDTTGIEVRIPHADNVTCEYVRVVITDAKAENVVTGETLEGECELIYWDEAEWQDLLGDVMPAIMMAIKRVTEGSCFEVEFGHAAFA